MKYNTSRKSIRPLVIEEKCVRGLRSCNNTERADGKVILIKSNPKTSNNILTDKEIINATI